MGSGRSSAALDKKLMRDIVELSLIEQYNWTPEYISTLSYKWIQKHNFIKSMKEHALETRRVQERIKNQDNRFK
jgi:hypothetical protein